jgi:hypothetical protein
MDAPTLKADSFNLTMGAKVRKCQVNVAGDIREKFPWVMLQLSL